jgi:hypothetical protein
MAKITAKKGQPGSEILHEMQILSDTHPSSEEKKYAPIDLQRPRALDF